MPNYILILFFLFVNSICNSQENKNLSGLVKSSYENLHGIVLELNNKTTVVYAISNEIGEYQFNKIDCNLNDTLTLKVNNQNFKQFQRDIIINENNIVLDVELEPFKIEQLAEVVLEADIKTKRLAGKSIYKINKKDYIKNATLGDVLSKIPSVFYNKNSSKTIVEGTLNGTIFIDGIQSKPNEIIQLNVSEIDKVEVINNPSSIYGVDFIGAIINIITKKSVKHFFKGSFDIGTGLVLNFNQIGGNLSYKKGFFNIKTNASFSKWKTISTSHLNRINNNKIFDSKSTSKFINFNNYLNTIVGLEFSKKLILSIEHYVGGYEFDYETNGLIENNLVKSNFVSLANIKNSENEIASVLKYKIRENAILNFKHTYLLEKDTNVNNLDNILFNVTSQSKANSFNVNYNLTDIKFIKKTTSITSDLKYINRTFNFFDSDFYINQNIFNATIDISNQWTDKFSSQTAFTYENSENKNDLFNKKYSLLLPTINFLYSFEKKIDLSSGYSRRILRPSASDLNDKLIIGNSGNGYQGNSNLEQQIRNYFWLKINKAFESDEIGLKLFNSSINNFISNIYKKQGSLLIRTLENVAKYNSTGFNFSYTTTILKKISLNLDSGLSYNIIENYALDNVVNKNSGVTFNSSIYLDANFFKNKLAVSLSGYQDGPNYTLLSKSVTYPSFSLSVSTNLLKDKMKLSLYANNLLGNNFTGSNDSSFGNNFSQSSINRNNETNILFSISYNFGKTFDDIQVNKIENEDIRK